MQYVLIKCEGDEIKHTYQVLMIKNQSSQLIYPRLYEKKKGKLQIRTIDHKS